MIHNPEATRANSNPNGSTRKDMKRPGMISKARKDGESPVLTCPSKLRTRRNREEAARRFTTSRTLDHRPDSAMNPAPSKGNSNERINYNGFEFTEQNGFWILNKDNTNFIFRFNPNQVEKIDSELKPLANYESKPLYFNSENVLAESEIRTNLAQFVEKMQSACLEEECDESSQIRTCENNFIIIREGSKKISQEGNCVFIEGKTDDLTKLTDEFLFKILGIEG